MSDIEADKEQPYHLRWGPDVRELISGYLVRRANSLHHCLDCNCIIQDDTLHVSTYNEHYCLECAWRNLTS